MLPLPVEVVSVLNCFAPLFSDRVFSHALVLAVGAILAPAKRTVTSALRIMGRQSDGHFQNLHRVLNRARWSPLRASRVLLRLLVDAFVPGDRLVIALDETIERRRGKRIAAKGVYRDAVRSSHSHFVKTTGLRWLCLMLLADIPWAGRRWALPFLTVLSPSKNYYEKKGRRHMPVLERARQALRLLKRWMPEKLLIVVADSSYAALEWLDSVCHLACVITRLRLDAALYAPAPKRAPGTNGRPRKKGKRLPTLRDVLTSKKTKWKKLRLAQWYGKANKIVQVATGTALWYHAGKPPVAIRWVLIRDPHGDFEPQALLCTRQDFQPAAIIEYFTGRWQLEVTLQESRAHLGVETQRQWNGKAIMRTTPALLALYSIITLMARRLALRHPVVIRRAAWYAKDKATFSDTIAHVRRSIWLARGFSTSTWHKDAAKVPRSIFQSFIDAVAYGN